MTDDDAFRKKCGPTLEATNRWQARNSKQLLRDNKLERLMLDLYFGGRVGWAAAEYNLQEEGLIEMIQGHRAGQMSTDNGDNDWCDCRWTLTERGKRASMARWERVMLLDPPLEIAEWDAEAEANDIATDCGGCDVDDPWLAIHRRNLVNLDKRAERICQKSRRGSPAPFVSSRVRQDAASTAGFPPARGQPKARRGSL